MANKIGRRGRRKKKEKKKEMENTSKNRFRNQNPNLCTYTSQKHYPQRSSMHLDRVHLDYTILLVVQKPILVIVFRLWLMHNFVNNVRLAIYWLQLKLYRYPGHRQLLFSKCHSHHRCHSVCQWLLWMIISIWRKCFVRRIAV